MSMYELCGAHGISVEYTWWLESTNQPGLYNGNRPGCFGIIVYSIILLFVSTGRFDTSRRHHPMVITCYMYIRLCPERYAWTIIIHDPHMAGLPMFILILFQTEVCKWRLYQVIPVMKGDGMDFLSNQPFLSFTKRTGFYCCRVSCGDFHVSPRRISFFMVLHSQPVQTETGHVFKQCAPEWACYLSVNFTCGEAWCTATLLCWLTSCLLFNSMSLNRVARRVSFQKQLSGGSEHFWIVMSLGCLKTRDHPLRPNTLQWFWYEIHWCLRPLVLRHTQWSVTQQRVNLSTIQPSVCRGF